MSQELVLSSGAEEIFCQSARAVALTVPSVLLTFSDEDEYLLALELLKSRRIPHQCYGRPRILVPEAIASVFVNAKAEKIELVSDSIPLRAYQQDVWHGVVNDLVVMGTVRVVTNIRGINMDGMLP